MSDILRPLKQPVFARMFAANLLANVGFWIQDVVLGWLIAGLTRSPSIVAMVSAAAMLPTFLLALPAGALGDAVNHRAFLIRTQCAVFALVLIFALIVSLNFVTTYSIILFALLYGTLNAIAGPTRQAVLPSIVDKEDVGRSVMLTSVGYNGSRAFGPMVGGLMLAAFGPVIALLANALGAFTVFMAYLSWRGAEAKPKRPMRLYAASIDGIRYMLSRADLRLSLSLTGLYFLAIAPLWAFIPLVAQGFASGDSRIFSMFMMALGAGAATGGIFLRPATRGNFVASLRSGCFFSAVGLAAIAFSDRLPITLGGYFVAGLGWIGVTSGINSFTLMTADPAFRSRVISMVLIVFSGGLSLGSLFWGQFANQLGIAPAFGASACLLGLLGIFAARIVGRRGTDTGTEGAIDGEASIDPI